MRNREEKSKRKLSQSQLCHIMCLWLLWLLLVRWWVGVCPLFLGLVWRQRPNSSCFRTLFSLYILSAFCPLSSLSVPFLSFRQPFVSGDRWFSSQANQTGEQEKLRITARNSERGPFHGLLKKRKNTFFPVPLISFRFRTFVDERMIIPDLSSFFPSLPFQDLKKASRTRKQ